MRFRFFPSAPLAAACCGAILLTCTASLAQAQWRPTWSRQQPSDCAPAVPPTVAQPGTTATPSIIPQEVAQAPSSAPEFGSPLGGETFAASAVGYIDSAIPLTQFRLRYDAAYHDNRPARAEFFYAKCGC